MSCHVLPHSKYLDARNLKILQMFEMAMNGMGDANTGHFNRLSLLLDQGRIETCNTWRFPTIVYDAHVLRATVQNGIAKRKPHEIVLFS